MDLQEKLVENYFRLGLHQNEILNLMESIHNIIIHPRTLKRILKKLKLYRRKNFSNLDTVLTFINEQLEKSGYLHGYRWMHLKCIQNGLVVTQNTVREMLWLLDPNGVDIRKRKRLRRRQYGTKGPNCMWHVDSYDKLKPYGICINGAIDGFSRSILWLRAGRTSNDPKVVAGYFVQTIDKLGGHPHTIRSDMGTENSTMEKMQTTLRQIFPQDGTQKPSFIYGRSTGNQRIESWWSILRKHNSQYWMNLFETLKFEGLFNGTFLDKSLIQFCFLEIIQEELDEVSFEWNTHKISCSRNSRSPVGRPFIMYEAPALYETENCLIPLPSNIINPLYEGCVLYNNSCDEDIDALCKDIMEENNYLISHDVYNATKLYVNIRSKIYEILSNIID